jgi:1-carboxybiuret hydrolase
VPRAVEATFTGLGRGAAGVRIGVLGGYFQRMALAPALQAVQKVASALGTDRIVNWPEVDRARTAAFIITNAEGAALHLPDLKRRAADFDPHTRDRFIAGALLPAAWVVQAQRLRHWFARQVAATFRDVDVVLAPATPMTSPPIGTEWIEIAGQKMPARASMGLLTQPVSCIGLPVVTVPLWGLNSEQPHLPVGVQVIAARCGWLPNWSRAGS